MHRLEQQDAMKRELDFRFESILSKTWLLSLWRRRQGVRLGHFMTDGVVRDTLLVHTSILVDIIWHVETILLAQTNFILV